MKPLWTPRQLPQVHRQAARPAKGREISFLPVSEYPEAQKRLSTGDLGPYLNRATFASCDQVGRFETILGGLPSPVLRALHRGGEWVPHHNAMLRYRRDRAEAVLSLRQGNQWGTIVNAAELLQGRETEAEALAVLELAGRALKPVGLRAQDLRTPGYCASLILGRELTGDRPPATHLARFLNAFRGPRFEATVFGSLPQCHDYDISSAYPHYFRQLISTTAVFWRDSTDLALADDAAYAAILADVDVPDDLDRGPIAYRVGETNLYFPVGRLRQIWLNLPEIRLLLEHPEAGRIRKVYEGSWAIPFIDARPFGEIVERLYHIRRTAPEIAPFVKRILVAMWGKTQSRYQVGRTWWAPRFWNPVYSSHVTALMRADNYRRTLGQAVFGEFVDGFAVESPMRTGTGLGGLRHEGSGPMLVVTDMFKQSAWKRLFEDFRAIMEDDPDAQAVVVRNRYARTLAEVIEAGETGDQIGRPTEMIWPIPLGSSIRQMPLGGYDCRDFLTGTIPTRAPYEHELRTMSWIRHASSPLPVVPDEVF